jgi:hypothetical protein
MNVVRGVALMLAVLALQFITTGALLAQASPRAGLVIVHGDGTVATSCVELGSESISGYDLLSKSGIGILAEPSGMGMTICKLDGEGCGAQESCFCQCKGSPCIYWSYWQMVDGAWRYSNLGAANTRPTDGSLEAWVWGDGTSGQAPQPPAMSFADVCSATTISTTLVGEQAVTETASSAAATSAHVASVESTPPAPGTLEAPEETLLMVMVVLIPLPLLAIAYWFWRRKGVA